MNQGRVGLPVVHLGRLSSLSGLAVSFFFTLSGFLITYLLLDEAKRTGDIAVWPFYVRRALRIWPLYFLVVALGLVVYLVVFPALRVDYSIQFPLGWGLLLFASFAPHLLSALYPVGGLLNPLWSIGVEEHFYLSWAPVVRRFREHLAIVLWSVLLVFVGIERWAAWGHTLSAQPAWQYKLASLMRLQYMAAGGLLAVAYARSPERFLRLPCFGNRWVQAGLWVALALWLTLGGLSVSWPVTVALTLGGFVWLIAEVGLNPRPLWRPWGRPTESLGKLAYGIYLSHMFLVYAVGWLFLRWTDRPTGVLYGALYYALGVGGTIAVAAASYALFERPILGWKRRFSR